MKKKLKEGLQQSSTIKHKKRPSLRCSAPIKEFIYQEEGETKHFFLHRATCMKKFHPINMSYVRGNYWINIRDNDKIVLFYSYGGRKLTERICTSVTKAENWKCIFSILSLINNLATTISNNQLWTTWSMHFRKDIHIV